MALPYLGPFTALTAYVCGSRSTRSTAVDTFDFAGVSDPTDSGWPSRSLRQPRGEVPQDRQSRLL